MRTDFAVVRIGQLLTMRGISPGEWHSEPEVIADGAVVVRAGRISAVGETDELEIPDGIEVINVGGRGLVTPGFVDAHTHLPFAGQRCQDFSMKCQGATYQEIAAQGGGIRRSMQHLADCDDLLEQTRRRLDWMIACGTVAAEAKSGYGQVEELEAKQLRVIQQLSTTDQRLKLVPTYLALHGPAPDSGHERQEFIRHVCEHVVPRFAREGLCTAVDAFIEEGYYTPDEAQTLAASARKYGLGVRLHVDQFGDHGGAALAAELGCLTADHLEHSSPEGLDALHRAGTMPVFLPTSVHALRLNQYPNAAYAMEQGIPFALATDFNPGSAPSPSMAFAMHLGCIRMGLSPGQAWMAATTNAGHAIGVAKDYGSIEAGKKAALLFWDLDQYQEVPYWIDGPRPVRLDF